MDNATGRFQRIWLNLSLRRKGLIVTAIPVLALLAFSAAFFVVQLQYRKAGRWVRSGLEVYVSLQRVRTVLLEEDNAARGYALAGDPRYLQDYKAATVRRNEPLRQLQSLLGNRAGQLEHLKTLEASIAERQAVTDKFIAAFARSSEPPAKLPSEPWMEKNRVVMVRIDSELAAIQRIDRRLLIADSAALARALKASDVTGLAAIVVGLIGGIVPMLLFASGIVRRIARLQKNASGLAEGRMPALNEFARDEIGGFGKALQGAANLLNQRTADLEQRARELAQSEAGNRKQTELLRCILDSMGDAVVVADQSGRVVLSNPAAAVLMGEYAVNSTPAEWLEQRSVFRSDGVTPLPLDELPLVCAIRGESPRNTEMFVRHKAAPDGVWVHVTATPLREEHGLRGGVAVLRDISGVKRNEEILRIARAEAEQANHAKSEFLSRMSHELRTPLNAILGFAQLLDLDPLSAPQQQSVDQILKGGRHLLNLINEVLDLARIEAGRMTFSTEPIHAGEAIQSAIDLVDPLATQSCVTLRLEASPDWKRHVLADRQRFQQVVLNLLSNAIKYNRFGGTVTVACSVSEDRRFRLAIRDTGHGLAPDSLPRLFQPFERLGADQSGIEGTGIGLALSQRLVVAMGGKLGVDSQVGAGSTFWVDLPICEGPVQTYDQLHRGDPREQPVSQETSAKTTKVLYIEDNLSNNLLMERILENRPEVQLISSMQGRLGIELALQHTPDLILLDLHLPDLTGDEVLRILRSQPATSSIPVAMISADATPGQIERLLASGAKAYFTKPLDVRNLLHFIDEVLGVEV